MVVYQVSSYQRNLEYDTTRLIELSMIEFYIMTLEDGYLPSGRTSFDDYTIYYVVNDTTFEYEITSTIQKGTTYTKSFKVMIDCYTNEITEFELE